jgi:hypothetical protein
MRLVTITSEQHDQFRNLALRTGKSFDDLIQTALGEWMETTGIDMLRVVYDRSATWNTLKPTQSRA